VDNRNILGLTVKYPEPGTVKTRLAREIGDGEACRVYRTIAEKIISKTVPDGSHYERIIFYSPSSFELKMRKWLPAESIIPQRGGDIGEIMDNAFFDMFASGAQKAVVTGVDIPGLNRHLVNLAFLELEQADVVIGPATDGGYYLVGMKSQFSRIFRSMPWGTAEVFRETVRVIDNLGLKVQVLAAMTDVDTMEDLLKVRDLHPAYFEED
jgi:rSAM/selenodomain-associated transferase 1